MKMDILTSKCFIFLFSPFCLSEGDQDKDEKENEGEEELDKQMGDVDGPESDKLDERMWGDEEEEEDEEKKNKEKDDEFGDGMDEEESRMVAQEENQGEAGNVGFIGKIK